MFNFSKNFKYILHNFDVSMYLEQAENILENRLKFIHPWDMERTSQYFDIPKDWNDHVNDDEEWIFMRSRMNYFDSLFLAYEKSKDKKYLNKIKEIIFDFINTHKTLKFELSTRTLDSGIRIINILKALIYLKELKCLSEYEENDIVNHLDKTCIYLFNSFIEKYYHSNWGYIQMAGVYTFALMYNKEYVKKAKEYMKIQLKTQIDDDGLHIEKSMTYHYQMLIYTAWVVMIEKNVGINKTLFTKYLKKMLEAAEKLHYPNFRQINFGDSDDDNVEDILSMANAILKRNARYRLKESSYMFAGDFVCGYKINKANDKRREYLLKESGYYNLIDKNYSFSTYLTNMTSGHLHVDLFHFNYFNKVEMLVDNGRYTYLDNEYRKYLKSSYAHNTLVLDNKEFLAIKDSWEYIGKYPLISPIYKIEDKGVTCIKMNVFDIETNSYIERKFILCEDNVIIINRIYSKGKHNLKMYYHFHPRLEIDGEKERLLLNKEIYFNIGEYIMGEGIYSSRYNEKEKSKFVKLEYDFNDNIQIIHKILNKNIQFEEICCENSIYSCKIISGNKEYMIFCKNEDSIEKQNVLYIQNNLLYKNFKVVVK
ncbi:heparinase II/III family protein [Streptobacillus moniliformis]|uniref:heparinase II/III family protein n=1 Tax=Streptobacillus moniliformis TaxID=34105 RepID=UPI0007E445B4|nr:heparinase II/III family protein [Streptobacillus moniliformis]